MKRGTPDLESEGLGVGLGVDIVFPSLSSFNYKMATHKHNNYIRQ